MQFGIEDTQKKSWRRVDSIDRWRLVVPFQEWMRRSSRANGRDVERRIAAFFGHRRHPRGDREPRRGEAQRAFSILPGRPRREGRLFVKGS